MADQNLVTAAGEIADVRQARPHLVLVGAGASRAAVPDGERSGRRLPLMADFLEIVPVAPIPQKNGIDWRGKSSEELNSLISENAEHNALLTRIEQAVIELLFQASAPRQADTLRHSDPWPEAKGCHSHVQSGPIPCPGMTAKRQANEKIALPAFLTRQCGTRVLYSGQLPGASRATLPSMP